MKSIAKNIYEKEVAGMRLFAAHTGARDVVSVEGSVLGGSSMLPRPKEYAANIAAELLDAGTTKKSKSQLREALSARGISLSFAAGGERTYFSASCLPEDLSPLLTIITECLSSSRFEAKEVQLLKERMLSDLKEEKTDTMAQGSQTLSRQLYDPKHENYVDTTATRTKWLTLIDPKEVRDFGKKYGRNGLVLSIVGDIDAAAAGTLAERIFKKLPQGTHLTPSKTRNSKEIVANEQLITIKDKTSIDVYLGVSLPIIKKDSRYIALSMLCTMLGGSGFTSHLSKTIRERDGLTYHVRASLAGFADEADGFLRIYASFSPATFTHSIAQLRKEIAIFFKSEITEKSLEGQKVEAAARYLMNLSTTRGLASALHAIGVEGRALSYLDEYPESIEKLTLADIQEAATLIGRDALSLAAAGTFQP
jgi:zinc protease